MTDNSDIESRSTVNKVKNDLKKFIDSADKSDTKLVFTVNDILSRAERAHIHQFVRDNKLHSMSYQYKMTSNKYMVVSFHELKKDASIVDHDVIRAFSNDTGIAIPVPLGEYLPHYLFALDKFSDAKTKYTLFMKAIDKLGNISMYNDARAKLIDEVVAVIKKHVDVTGFKKRTIDIPEAKEKLSKQVYQAGNDKKWFLSIDIRSANFNITNHYYPDCFGKNKDGNTWVDFMKTFTDVEFFHTCKHIREIMFGKSGLMSKIQQLYPVFMARVKTSIDKLDPKGEFKLVVQSGDELIYEIDEKTDVTAVKHAIEQQYPGFYHVDKFRLVKLGTQAIYVKEFDTGKRDVKCCNPVYLMQAIAFYEGRKPDTIDLKFLFESRVATFDTPVEFT